MTLPANIRLQTPVPFPATVQGSGPIAISKKNGIWTVSYSVANLQIQAPPLGSKFATDYITVWDSVAQQFVNVPLSVIGSPVLLNTLTANNSTNLQDITSLALGFNEYEVVFENVIPASNGVGFEMLVQSGGVFQTTGYLNSSGGVTTYVDLTQATTLGNTAGGGFSGTARIFGSPSSTNKFKLVRSFGTFETNAGAAAASGGAGWWNGGQGAITGLQFLMTGGNISSGTIKIYGSI